MAITGAARLAGIMGWPVAHSRSPALHGFWLGEHGIDGAYVPLAVPPDRLEQALRALPALGFRGCNLTIPHKQAALAVMDRVDPFARRIGAMNTVIVAADGSLEGSNTDVYGFRENLREQAAGLGPGGGAGGGARRRRQRPGGGRSAGRGGGFARFAWSTARATAPKPWPANSPSRARTSPSTRGRRAPRRCAAPASSSTPPASAWTRNRRSI